MYDPLGKHSRAALIVDPVLQAVLQLADRNVMVILKVMVQRGKKKKKERCINFKKYLKYPVLNGIDIRKG